MISVSMARASEQSLLPSGPPKRGQKIRRLVPRHNCHKKCQTSFWHLFLTVLPCVGTVEECRSLSWHFLTIRVAIASASYRMEKPRNSENRKTNRQKEYTKNWWKIGTNRKFLVLPICLPIFWISGLFFYSVAGQLSRKICDVFWHGPFPLAPSAVRWFKNKAPRLKCKGHSRSSTRSSMLFSEQLSEAHLTT